MNIALLTVSSLSLVASVGTLAVLLKTVHELNQAKQKVEALEAKIQHNASVVKGALGALDI